MDNNPLHTVASDENLGPVFLGIDWTVFSLSTIIVLIRLYTRTWITRNLGWDDAMIALAQGITAVGKGFVVTEVSYGLGQHRANISFDNYRNFLKYNYLDTAQFFIALATCKISICLFLLRLSQFNKLKHVLWSLIGFLVVTHFILFLLIVLQCNPVHKVWDLDTPGKCFSKQVVMNITIVQGVFSFLTDFICAAFPIVLLRNLRIRRPQKTALCILMSLGVITGAVAIARTATAYQVKSPDLSWVGIPNAMTRIFEVNIGNTAACIPILKPFTRYIHALVTGRDPHEILHRKSSATSLHERWYTRRRGFWTRGRSLAGDEYARQRGGDAGLPPGVLKMRPVQAENNHHVNEDAMRTERSWSLALPMQGARRGNGDGKSLPNVPSVPDLREYKAGDDRGSRTEVGEGLHVKDIV